MIWYRYNIFHFLRSWHEFGTYDTAASIDYILTHTGTPRVSLVGHSMGGTVELVLLSKRPEYNDKVNVAVTFAPVAIFTHPLPGLITTIGIRYGKQIEVTSEFPISCYLLCTVKSVEFYDAYCCILNRKL